MAMNEELKKELDEKGTSVFIPFLVGSLIGAGIALLLAPKSGKEIRSDMRNYAARTKDSLVSAVDETKKTYQEGKDTVMSAFEAGKAVFQHEKERHQKAA
jgi:gas vesicle protein